MTIRQFARLCGCNPQTLRYYDHEDLLKPVEVDQWSGYRYYREDQALDYVKIRNLQTAGFSIGEIRELLDKDTSAVCEAFDAKIAEQEKRLEEMKNIRRSYRSEMTQIQEKISKIKAFIEHAMKQYDAETEFGINEDQYGEMVDMMTGALDQTIANAPDVPDIGEMPDGGAMPQPRQQETPDFLNDPAFEVVYEKHGWTYAKEFLDDISNLEDGAEYSLRFRLGESKQNHVVAFMNTMLSILLARNPGKQKTLTCNVDKSKDGRNHFWFLKRKA